MYPRRFRDGAIWNMIDNMDFDKITIPVNNHKENHAHKQESVSIITILGNGFDLSHQSKTKPP